MILAVKRWVRVGTCPTAVPKEYATGTQLAAPWTRGKHAFECKTPLYELPERTRLSRSVTCEKCHERAAEHSKRNRFLGVVGDAVILVGLYRRLR
jgi:hypothetical protein